MAQLVLAELKGALSAAARGHGGTGCALLGAPLVFVELNPDLLEGSVRSDA